MISRHEMTREFLMQGDGSEIIKWPKKHCMWRC